MCCSDEEYEECKRLKNAIDYLKEVGKEITELEIRKREAVGKEDYDLALEYKVRLGAAFLSSLFSLVSSRVFPVLTMRAAATARSDAQRGQAEDHATRHASAVAPAARPARPATGSCSSCRCTRRHSNRRGGRGGRACRLCGRTVRSVLLCSPSDTKRFFSDVFFWQFWFV